MSLDPKLQSQLTQLWDDYVTIGQTLEEAWKTLQAIDNVLGTNHVRGLHPDRAHFALKRSSETWKEINQAIQAGRAGGVSHD